MEKDAFNSAEGYPLIRIPPFEIIKSYLDAALDIPVPPHFEICVDLSAYAMVQAFFNHVMDGVQAMDRNLTIEFAAGDLMAGVPKLINGDLGPRPETFPKQYLRVWLSNVP